MAIIEVDAEGTAQEITRLLMAHHAETVGGEVPDDAVVDASEFPSLSLAFQDGDRIVGHLVGSFDAMGGGADRLARR